MTQVAAQETAQEVRAHAEAWYRRQVETLRQSYGPAWAEHREWLLNYLREEVRQRLLARGWRAAAHD